MIYLHQRIAQVLRKSKLADRVLTNITVCILTARCSRPEKQSATAPVKKKSHIVRPKSTLSALVSHYNIKVPKMNTLEKSRLDWQGYVEREGIRDELKYKNKDG